VNSTDHRLLQPALLELADGTRIRVMPSSVTVVSSSS
jgi:hypothetical protein